MIDNRGSIVKLMAFQKDTIMMQIDRRKGMAWIIPVKEPKFFLVKSVHAQPFSLREESSMADHGKRVQVTISGRLPKAEVTDEQLELLQNGEFIVVTVDAEGNARVSGSGQIPLTCNVKNETGEQLQDFNGYSLTFEAIESQLSWKCARAPVTDVLYGI